MHTADITGKRVAILVYNHFEQAEFEEPLKALKDAGADVHVVSASTTDLQGLNHIEKGGRFTADVLLTNAKPEQYDALVLPGGVVNADKLRMVGEAQDWVNHFIDEGKLVAAICHAPWLLVSADAIESRRLTSYYTLQDDIKNAGGDWTDQSVVIDGSLITSRQPSDLADFNKAVLNALKPKPIIL